MICLILNYNLSTNGWNRKITAHLKNRVIFSDLLLCRHPSEPDDKTKVLPLALSWTVPLPMSSCSSAQSSLLPQGNWWGVVSPKIEDALVPSQLETPLWTRPSGQMQNRILFPYCPMQEVDESSCSLKKHQWLNLLLVAQGSVLCTKWGSWQDGASC